MFKKSILVLVSGLFWSTVTLAQPVILGPLDARNNLSEIAGNGSTAQTAARTNLGLGSIATQGANAAAITGGNIAGASIGSAVVTPTGAPTPTTAAALAAQQGVLLDTFKVAGDADDTASMTRAVASGVPILLGPRTYTINNYGMVGTPAQFTLQGVPGQSIIQRTSASGSSQFFAISAKKIAINGVTFDMNSASVTANQWGVYLSGGGQTVSIKNSVFKGNSGSLGICLGIFTTAPNDGGSYIISGNEFTNCTAPIGGTLYLATASHGLISDNFIHDNSGNGIFAQSNGTATTTNYITDVTIKNNRIERNGGTGVAVGGYAPPYSFAIPPATYIMVQGNSLVDNAKYAIFGGGDFLNFTNNQISQSSSSVTIYGGIDCNCRFTSIQNNTVTLYASGWGIDIGGSIQMSLQDNLVTMTTTGTALNVGGNVNTKVSDNHLILAGTATGITDYAVESGGGAVFSTPASGTVIEKNTIDLAGNTTIGIYLPDNPGGYPGATAQVVRNNSFNGGSAYAVNAIVWYGSPGSLFINGNLYNGSQKQFSDPVTSPNDVVFDNVYFGGTVSGAGSTNTARAIIPRWLSTSQSASNGNVYYVTPATGGSGYSAATTIVISGTGCTGQVFTPQIIGGVIIGTRMGNIGSGCSGTVTAAAVDSGGGTGATFTVGNIPKLPVGASITYLSLSNYLLQRNGGAVPIGNTPIIMTSGGAVQLQATSSNTWTVVGATTPVVATSVLTTIGCNSTSTGATAIVTDALSPTYGGNLTGGGAVRVAVACVSPNWITN